MLKKAIDKVMKSGYNTHTGLEVSNRDEYTINKTTTDRVFANIETLDKAMREATTNIDIDYVIAGGAVRDGLMGLPPKDYDIFLNLSRLDPEDEDGRDDLITLLNYNFHDKVRANIPLIRGDFETPWTVHNEAYKAMENTFFVYEHVFGGEEEPMAAIGNDNTYQLIYRKNNPDIGTDPLGFVVNNFDWPLTKAYYKDGKVFVGQEFADAFKTKKISSTDLNTSRRIRAWIGRYPEDVHFDWKMDLVPEPKLDTQLKYYNTIFDRPIARPEPAPRLAIRDWDPEEWRLGVRNAQFVGEPGRVVQNPAQEIDWPQAAELPPREGVVQLNNAQAEININRAREIFRRVDENQAQDAPAVPEV